MSGIEATLTGWLGRDAELRYTARGQAMLTFSVAVKDDHRRPEQETQWVRVAVFGDRAEELDGQLTKGNQVTCAGRLVVKLWQGRPDLELYCWEVQLVGPPRSPRGQRRHREPFQLGSGTAGRRLPDAVAVHGGRTTGAALGRHDDEDLDELPW